MTEAEHDDILWEIGRSPEATAAGALADDVLLAYRAGELSDAEARRVEAVLGHDPEVRRRLAELVGMAAPAPSQQVRSRVLAAFSSGGVVTILQRRRPRWWLAAAAGVAACLICGLLLMLTPSSHLPTDLDFDVTVSGLKTSRAPSEHGPGQPVRAEPDTVVRIMAVPKRGAVGQLAFGLYRHDSGALTRIDDRPDVLLASDRGTLSIELPAGSVLGSEPRISDLYLVVARSGQLPRSRLDLAPGSEPQRILAGDGSRRVYRLTIEFVDPTTTEDES